MGDLLNSSMPKEKFAVIANLTDKIKESLKTENKQNTTNIKPFPEHNVNGQVAYDRELSHIMDKLSTTMSRTKLSESEAFTLKSFMNTIRGLQNSGNTKTAYVVAKNAMTFLSGASYPYDIPLSTEYTTGKSGVKVDFSDKARLYKPFTGQSVRMQREANSSADITGLYINRKI
ncbi:MAG: hypothetical protein ACOCV8_06145 [Spirochaetota bacterium]